MFHIFDGANVERLPSLWGKVCEYIQMYAYTDIMTLKIKDDILIKYISVITTIQQQNN